MRYGKTKNRKHIILFFLEQLQHSTHPTFIICNIKHTKDADSVVKVLYAYYRSLETKTKLY